MTKIVAPLILLAGLGILAPAHAATSDGGTPPPATPAAQAAAPKVAATPKTASVTSHAMMAPRAPLTGRPTGRPKVYLLRGFLNVFSLGMDQLAQELEQRGISAEVYNHMSAGSVSAEAIQACKSGQVSSIILVGHSLGASAAVGVAADLNAAGVKVAGVIMLDPVVRTVVPPNVAMLRNIYISNGAGVAAEPSERFKGSLQNVDMKNDPSMGHVSMATSPAVHARMLQYIMAAKNSHC